MSAIKRSRRKSFATLAHAQKKAKLNEVQKSFMLDVQSKDKETGTGFVYHMCTVERIYNFFKECSERLEQIAGEPSILSLIKDGLAKSENDQFKWMVMSSLDRACASVLLEKWPNLLERDMQYCVTVPLLKRAIDRKNSTLQKLVDDFVCAKSTYDYQNFNPPEAIALMKFVFDDDDAKQILDDADKKAKTLPYFEI